MKEDECFCTIRVEALLFRQRTRQESTQRRRKSSYTITTWKGTARRRQTEYGKSEKSGEIMNAEETKRWKAKQLRYKKPIVRDLNLDKIQEDLWNIMEECENIRWYTDSDDGNDSLINALDGDGDEAYEFKMAFADLCAECERMQEDLREEWIPNCFDIFLWLQVQGKASGDCLVGIPLKEIISELTVQMLGLKTKPRRN